MSLVTELGDISRFDSPRELMAYVGLVPSEHTSGGKQKRGGITKTGNGRVRRLLVEAAWSYRFPARQSYHMQKKAEKATKPAQAIAWKAQKRLCNRYRVLQRNGKEPGKGRDGDRKRTERFCLGDCLRRYGRAEDEVDREALNRMHALRADVPETMGDGRRRLCVRAEAPRHRDGELESRVQPQSRALRAKSACTVEIRLKTLSHSTNARKYIYEKCSRGNITSGRVASLVEAMENASAFWLLRSLYQRRRTTGGQRWRFPQPPSNKKNGD